MRHLRRTIREIIQEMAMKQGDDLPAGYYFSCAQGIDAAYGMPQILLVREDGYVDWRNKVECYFASMHFEDKDVIEELGYTPFDLRRLDSQPGGFGPLVTEIAIEWATLMGGVLFPDRRSMSEDALIMWSKFSGRRGFEEFNHPTLGVKGYRRIGRPTTMKALEARNQLFRKRYPNGTQKPPKYTRLSLDFERK